MDVPWVIRMNAGLVMGGAKLQEIKTWSRPLSGGW